MDTLQQRLADLAGDAPTGGAPPAELWTRGRRAQRRRVAAVVAGVLVVGAVGTGIGLRLAGDEDRTTPDPAGEIDIPLPIEYPVGQDLPDLGHEPGPLAAVWVAPGAPYTLYDDLADTQPRAVGLVAETGEFGTLPIELSESIYEAPNAQLALSPDGRRVAYYPPTDTDGSPDDDETPHVAVLDLVTGEEYTPTAELGVRGGAAWVDATHLAGHVAGGTDIDGWVWEPGTEPRLVNPYPYLEANDPRFSVLERWTPWACREPRMTDGTGRMETSALCDDLGSIGSEVLLGHLNPGTPDPDDLDRPVVALDVSDAADFPFDDPALRRVVVAPGAPYPVSFATDLLAEALDEDGGA